MQGAIGVRLILVLLASVLIALTEGAQAADPALCRNCHNPQGTIAPDLAGMPMDTFFAAVRAFNSEERTHPVMVSFSRSLSDADIAGLAASFAAVGTTENGRVEVKSSPPAK